MMLVVGLLAAAPAVGQMILPLAFAEVITTGPDPGPGPMPEDAVLEADKAQIGRVILRIGDVFDEDDPEENKRVFRFVNSLHIKTRARVIREDLLFGEGDAYDRRLLDESERILRTRDYLYDAEIEPVGYADGEVDVEVRTRDVWTLTGGVGFGRAGGENDVTVSLRDENFLGTGKELGVKHVSGVDRTTSEVVFREDTLLGTRVKTELSLSFNSDGGRYLLNLWKPFYALNARRTARLTILDEERIDPQFERGEKVSELGHKIEFYEAYWGLSTGLRDGSAHRWTFGVTHDRDRFFAVGGTADTTPIPPERSFSRPWIDYEWIQDRFVEMKDLEKIARTEDINLGTRVRARLGWASTAFGATDDLAVISFSASRGFRPGKRMLLFSDNALGARTGSEQFDSVGASSRFRFYWRNWGQHTLFAELQGDLVDNLDPERQLTIGGDSGLRGYPLRFEEGNRRVLFSVEQRFFTGWEIFKLANVGAAVFFDAGRAWFNNQQNDLGVLKDVGLGLRLSPSRSSGKSIVHFDVAFPLDGDDTIDSVQWLVTTKKSL
ncbi:MAG: hypothetical protein ACE5EG_00495 [Thermoanaerobaculia bacterium]